MDFFDISIDIVPLSRHKRRLSAVYELYVYTYACICVCVCADETCEWGGVTTNVVNKQIPMSNGVRRIENYIRRPVWNVSGFVYKDDGCCWQRKRTESVSPSAETAVYLLRTFRPSSFVRNVTGRVSLSRTRLGNFRNPIRKQLKRMI